MTPDQVVDRAEAREAAKEAARRAKLEKLTPRLRAGKYTGKPPNTSCTISTRPQACLA